MTLSLKPGTAWADVYARARAAAPEAFDEDRILNLIGGEWKRLGTPGEHVTPVDGTPIQGPPRIDHDDAVTAVAQAAGEHKAWGEVDLDERKSRVLEAVESLTAERETLALLLVWEIGKPWRLACADVDRALDGVRWYIEEIERQLAGRRPLPGPGRNIASWNYPMSGQIHAELVQALAGNAVVAKTPSQGGFHTLTLAHALMRRAGLPVTLLSGVGAELGNALISAPEIGALAFVGGRTNGRRAATTLADTGKRHFLEQEGLNAWGIWDFSAWDDLAAHLKKGFEYAKQRCTAYPRYVVQRELFPEFLEMYLPVAQSLRFGHPLAVETSFDPLPDLDFGQRESGRARRGLCRGSPGWSCPALPRGRLRRSVPRRPGHVRVRRTGVRARTAEQLVPAPRRAVRPAGLGGHRGHRVRAPGRDERVQRLTRRLGRVRRP
jgi:acyl-CoA reductase-like NAD-dependent aldehyde dehydrogenase